jgi:hypothetical protein
MAAVLGCAAAAHACEPALSGEGVRLAAGTDYVVAWKPVPAPLKVSEFFTLELAVCANSGVAPAELRVDATMPEHKHGMNYRPAVTTLGNGRFRAEGFMLHMPGMWEFSFDVRAPGRQEQVRDRVTVR